MSAKPRGKLGILLNFLIIITLISLIIVILGGGFLIFKIIKEAPPLNIISIKPNKYTSIVYSEITGDEILRFNGDENREYVTLDKVPIDLKNAFVALEDERFYDHNGIDFRSIARAIYLNFTENKKQGASTITQQVIKNNITKLTKNDYSTKIQEQYLALRYEKELAKKEHYGTKEASKDYILEVYLNTIGLHHGLNGVKTAAKYYFDKDVSDLTLSECAVIAAITQNPSKYSPTANPENNRNRQLLTLRKMNELNMITDVEMLNAIDDDVYSRIVSNTENLEKDSTLSYFSDQLIQSLSEDLQQLLNISQAEAFNYIYNGGLKIYSTQDFHMQEIMDNSFLNDSFFPASDFEIDIQYYLSVKKNATNTVEHFQRNETVKREDQIEPFILSVKEELMEENDELVSETTFAIPQPQAAMVIIDYKTGKVKALAGGRGDKQVSLSLNRATNSERQPGSVFKILAAYAPAIDLGYITSGTVVEDSPYSYKGYTPRNWYVGYRGFVTIRQAIRDSMNVIAVKTMMNTGIDKSFEYLEKFGFTTLVDSKEIDGQIYTDKIPSLALGGITSGVTQLEVTAAYGAIANKGNYIKPYFYTKVYDHNGDILIDNTQKEPVQVLKASSAYALTDMMKDVVTGGGTGSKARFSKVRMPIAGKTGTTTNTKDLTFVGYTPYYVSGVWLGFDHPKVMKEDKGYHMRLWSDIMEKIHSDLPYVDFEKSGEFVQVRICTQTGNLPSSNCPTKVEMFEIGTQPTARCTGNHYSITAPTQDNEIVPPIEEVQPSFEKPIFDLNESFTITPKPLIENKDTEIKEPAIYTPPTGETLTIYTPEPIPVATETPVPEYSPAPQPTQTEPPIQTEPPVAPTEKSKLPSIDTPNI